MTFFEYFFNAGMRIKQETGRPHAESTSPKTAISSRRANQLIRKGACGFGSCMHPSTDYLSAALAEMAVCKRHKKSDNVILFL